MKPRKKRLVASDAPLQEIWANGTYKWRTARCVKIYRYKGAYYLVDRTNYLFETYIFKLMPGRSNLRYFQNGGKV